MRDPMRWVTPLTVRLGSGLVQVMQLDDEGMRTALGIEVRHINRREIEITGKPEALQRVMDDCNNRQGGGWDQPLWYASSARAAAKKIARVMLDAGVR